MDPFLKMDIFFFVATVGVVLFIAAGAFVLWRLERILKNIEHISKRVADESDNVHDDLVELRDTVRRGTGRLWALLSFLSALPKRKSKKADKKS